MRERSQTTVIATIKAHYIAWRKREGWSSREALAEAFVERYNESIGPEVTGLKFDPNTRDIFERAKVNADRIFRWLDEESKDTNLLPANMVPYMMQALPMDLRISCSNEILGPTGLTVRVDSAEDEANLQSVLQHMAKESGEAVAAMAALLDGATEEELKNALREVTEAHAATQEALTLVHARLKVEAN
jgi:hypothetical protein